MGRAGFGVVQAQDRTDLLFRIGVTLLLFVVGPKLDLLPPCATSGRWRRPRTWGNWPSPSPAVSCWRWAYVILYSQAPFERLAPWQGVSRAADRCVNWRVRFESSSDHDGASQILLLLGVAVAVVVMFQRLHVPTSLGYLLVGVILGPHTVGPTVYVPEFSTLAEFGLVFLLFTIGLNFSLPQLHALRRQVLGLGTGQVMFTTAVVGLAVWLAGLPAAAAFVVGAVFAQSSTAIIGSQLAEQGEENSPHGRLGLAMSVFQDVTVVPFLVVIPVLGMTVGADVLGADLGWALAKGVAAFALLLLAGRWLLRPLFHLVTKKRSAEVLTLTVLLVVLLAAWFTSSLGLSLALGAFLAGMMLGDTEFRHQVEASNRPFRDVLLGLFFIGIGMRFA